jgi:signal transduction histidine kinase
MAKLLTDLLEYSRVGTKLSSVESINFYDFCHNIHSLSAGSDTFELTISPVEVQLPRVGVQIVMLNLINNAIKHSNKDKGTIDVQIAKTTGGYNISVTDDGPGVPSEYQHKIFEMFQTLKSRDAVEGSGMGLAMVKKVIEFYGGSVTLDISYTDGCRIKIFWPCKTNTCTKLKKV